MNLQEAIAQLQRVIAALDIEMPSDAGYVEQIQQVLDTLTQMKTHDNFQCALCENAAQPQFTVQASVFGLSDSAHKYKRAECLVVQLAKQQLLQEHYEQIDSEAQESVARRKQTSGVRLKQR